MKIRNLGLLGYLFLVGQVMAQTLPISTNYIVKTTIKKAGITSLSNIPTTCSDKAVAIDYFDDMGRPIQSVGWQASSSQKDIIQPQEYDDMGRNAKNFLPYSGSTGTGTYDPLATKDASGNYPGSNQHQYYQSSLRVMDNSPYSVTLYEKTPLGREIEKGAAGATWQPVEVDGVSDGTGHTLKIKVIGNVASEVRLFGVLNDELIDNGYCSDQLLQKTILKDENWSPEQTGTQARLHTAEVFKDNTGNLVLRRTFVEDGADADADPDIMDTYYVYDELNLLRFVLPPMAVKNKYNPTDYSSLGNYRVIDQDESLATPETNVNSYLVSTNGTLTLTPEFEFTPSADHSLIITSGDINGSQIFSYNYDIYKRLIEKTIPGAAPVYIVYDDRDRMVAKQDGEQRKKGEWNFIKYDAFNRPIITGTLNNGITSQSEMQQEVDAFYALATSEYYEEQSIATGSVCGYTNDKSYPVGVTQQDLLTVTYYDTYDWKGTEAAVATYYAALNTKFNSHGFSGVTVPVITRSISSVRGLVTGTLVKVLDNTNTWMESVVFYDDRYRPILAKSDNYVGGEDVVLTKYNFVGAVDESWLCHTNNKTTPGTRFIRQINEYDHVGRLTITKQQMTGAYTLVTIAKNVYNELGQLVTKYVGGDTEATCAQAMDYMYTIRGWLSKINNPDIAAADKRKFSMRLNYTNQLAGLNSPTQYNGNISGVEWRTPANTSIGSPSDKQAYGYTYDATNRLISADYGQGNAGTVAADAYNLTINGYDQNGNILGLMRQQGSSGQIDNLSYSYLGNQLLSVADAATGTKKLGFNDGNGGSDYSYNANGNLTTDKNKGIQTIEYNYLNLVSKVTSSNNKTIEFVYDANGVKLAQKAQDGTITYYSGMFVYDNTALKYIIHDEGQYVLSGTTGEYQYNIKDYLGNVRLVVNQAGIEKQQSGYDPLGMQYLAGGSSDNKYLYKGAELQDDLIGTTILGWYDLGARMYDPQIGRFFIIDPMCEDNHLFSPYSYAANNPVSFIDFFGLDPVWVEEEETPTGYILAHWEDDQTHETMSMSEVIEFMTRKLADETAGAMTASMGPNAAADNGTTPQGNGFSSNGSIVFVSNAAIQKSIEGLKSVTKSVTYDWKGNKTVKYETTKIGTFGNYVKTYGIMASYSSEEIKWTGGGNEGKDIYGEIPSYDVVAKREAQGQGGEKSTLSKLYDGDWTPVTEVIASMAEKSFNEYLEMVAGDGPFSLLAGPIGAIGKAGQLGEKALQYGRLADKVHGTAATFKMAPINAKVMFNDITQGAEKITINTPKGTIIRANVGDGNFIQMRNFDRSGSHTTFDFINLNGSFYEFKFNY